MSALAGAPSPPAIEEPAVDESAIEEPGIEERRKMNANTDTEELPEEVPWVPRMDAIRKAQVAEVEALEEVVGALASKQQSSITKLRKQMNTILAWKAQTTAKDRKVAARRAGANASNRATVVTGEPANAKGSAVVTTADVCAIEISGDQSDAESFALVVEDNEDWEGLLEDPVEHGMCWAGRCTAIVCVRLLVAL